MYQNLTLFRMSHSMATHAGHRQALVSQNMANADTPDFRPRDLVSFREMVRRGDGLVATRGSHLHGAGVDPTQIVEVRSQTESPNGNAVSLEQEMLRAVSVKRQHDRAIAIYRHTMTMLRASIGKQ